MFLIKNEDKEQFRPKRQSNDSESLKQKFNNDKERNTVTTEESLEKLLRSINVFPVENKTVTKVKQIDHFRTGRSLKSVSLGEIIS